MPRRPRSFIVGMPYHIVQRGNNRQPCFYDEEDRYIYMGLWKAQSDRYDLPVHAYCLMTNHVHVLCTCRSENSISHTVKAVNSTYARYVNKKYSRTGTLWEGRFRSSLVQTRRYLLACYRYIEMNPVRAGIVSRPEDYPYSSYHSNALGQESWIELHPEFVSLGETPLARREAYQRMFKGPVEDEMTDLLRHGLRHGLAVGEESFLAALQEAYKLPKAYDHPGRPPRKK